MARFSNSRICSSTDAGRAGCWSRSRLCLEARHGIADAGGVFGDERDHVASYVNAVPLNGLRNALKFRRCDAGEGSRLEVQGAVFLQQRDRAVGGALADLELMHAKPGPIGGELQVSFLVANLAKALGLRRAAAARDQPKRAALSEQDAELQDLLAGRHPIVDFFHFVSFHDRSWDRLSQRTPTLTANKK